MCASCGCGILEEDHGDFRSLTFSDIEEAAEAAGISAEEVARNIQAAVFQAEELEEEMGMRRAS